MKNKSKIIICFMLGSVLFGNFSQIINAGSSAVWAQEKNKSLEPSQTEEEPVSVNSGEDQIESEETTEAIQSQEKVSLNEESNQVENEDTSHSATSSEGQSTENENNMEVGSINDSADKYAESKADGTILADVVEQTIELGTWSGEIPDVSKMFTNVRLEDGTAINASDYTAEVTSIPSFDNLAATDKISVKITRKSNGAATYVQVPVKMVWGNTIQLRGIIDSVAGAYTLHKVGNGYRLRSSYGQDNDYYPSGVHGYYPDTPYHSITLLRGSGKIDQLSSTYYKETKGTNTAKEVVENFGTNGQQYVQLGDVVKIWHREQKKNSYTKDEKEITYSTKNEDSTYFAITADGFIPYRLNQLKPKEITISASDSNADLDKRKDEMIDFSGYSGNDLKVSKITEYPDRSKTGVAKGKVLVEETIAGVTQTYEYEVTYNVTDDRRIWADVVEQTIELGTWSGEIPAVSKMITNVRLEDGTAIDSSGYTAEITSVPSFDNMTVTDKIGVKITRKSNGAMTYLQAPIKMSWGNTIQLRGYDNGTSGAYTLHKIGNTYYIRSSYGENKNYRSNGIHEYRKGMTYQSITLLRGTGRIDQLSSTYYEGFNGEITANEVVSSFGTNAQKDVQLGDVVQIWHKEQWRNSYTRNGSNVKYSDMDEGSVYFAVTADGFIPYRLNRLKPKETTITTKTTNAELDKQVSDLIDFLGMSGNGLKVSKITEYPDRSKAGTAKGKVLVEETI
ncbi:hypothetical protein IGJ66_001383 [Enterococcus sp. DIV0176]|uniref:hypothetical protein n=1 Tax=Enterococcus sp. DIV0176 TaxID=2774758 RepID=UPI003D2FC91D